MKAIRRILLLLDDRFGRTPAMERAIALTKAFKAELWLSLHDRGPKLGVLGIMDRPQAHQLEDMMRAQRSERLVDLKKSLLDEGVPAVHLIDDRFRLTAERVVDDVQLQRIDLVIKDASHPTLLKRLLLLPFEWSLLRESPVPVWLVAASADPKLPHRIVTAVDPVQPEHGAGRLNEALLETAGMLAETGHGDVRVLSAFAGLPELIDPMGMAIGISNEDLYEQMRRDHRRALQALMREHRLADDTATVLYGPPVAALLEALEDIRPDLLIVGTLQRHGVDRLFMGSTVERLIGEASCDVLTIPAVAAQPAVTATQAPVAAVH